ncbi:unnamed protein product [Orchesella dallaii]|uniref:F-box domain-containing protein n=1 Tax=Orchesella dallaii TaxID=48710 RepID=A0ABP1RY98_9HEXA
MKARPVWGAWELSGYGSGWKGWKYYTPVVVQHHVYEKGRGYGGGHHHGHGSKIKKRSHHGGRSWGWDWWKRRRPHGHGHGHHLRPTQRQMMTDGRAQHISDLPPEMLEEIFNYLTDPQDFQAVLNTCPSWHDIMAYRKTERLIAEVFPLVFKDTTSIPLESMLRIRETSRKWKELAETGLAHNTSRFRHPKYNFRTAEELEAFRTFATSLPRGSNPFAFRNMEIMWINEAAYVSFLEIIQEWGDQLKSIDIRATGLGFPQNELVSHLALLPNLKSLEIAGIPENWDVETGETTPFPPLPQLTNLKLTRVDRYNGNAAADQKFQHQISSFITAYGNQLEYLTCHTQLLRIEDIENQLPKLSFLLLWLSDNNTFNAEDFQVLAKVKWPLSTLDIFGYPPVKLSREFCGMISYFKDTLKHFALDFVLEEDIDTSSLEICPALKTVVLFITSSHRRIPTGIKNKVGQLGKFFPNLKKIGLHLFSTETFADEVDLDVGTVSNIFPEQEDFKLTRIM